MVAESPSGNALNFSGLLSPPNTLNPQPILLMKIKRLPFLCPLSTSCLLSGSLHSSIRSTTSFCLALGAAACCCPLPLPVSKQLLLHASICCLTTLPLITSLVAHSHFTHQFSVCHSSCCLTHICMCGGMTPHVFVLLSVVRNTCGYYVRDVQVVLLLYSTPYIESYEWIIARHFLKNFLPSLEQNSLKAEKACQIFSFHSVGRLLSMNGI